MKTDYIECGNNVDLIKSIPDNSIDMVITSPPYDGLRTYDGYTFDFKGIATELARVLKDGGVIVWIVSDATVDGSETGTSFKQALFFKEIGLNIYDTMIWQKDTLTFPDKGRYGQCFEYMFVISKGKPKTIQLIEDRKNKWSGSTLHGTSRGVNGITFRKSNDKKGVVKEYGARMNVWNISGVKNNQTGHPAPFPVKLVKDHINTWTSETDIVLDPFMGSGTSAVACIETNRRYIGFEISSKYCDMAEERIRKRKNELALFLMMEKVSE